MSSGSWLSHGVSAPAGEEGIGTVPGLMGPEEKLFLGWLDYSEVNAGQRGTYNARPVAAHLRRAPTRRSRSTCPNSTITNDYTTPPSGHATRGGRVAVTTCPTP